MPELNAGDVVREWRRLMEAAVSAGASVPREVADHLLLPVDAVFDLLAQSGEMLHKQADALEAAGKALNEAGALMKTQAELFETTIRALRQPTELAKRATGVKRKD